MAQLASALEKDAFIRALLLGSAKCGKAQPVDEPVLTPGGWRTMADIKVGDLVVGSNGQQTRVIGVYPQGVRKIVRVISSDGAWARCCTDHLWTTATRDDLRQGHLRQRPASVKTAQDIQETLDAVHYLPEPTGPVEFEREKPLPFDPYFLGLLVGDGSYTEAVGGVRFTCPDRELLDAILAGAAALGDEGVLYEEGERCPYIRLRGGNTIALLKQLEMHGQRSEEKIVPKSILTASVQDRLAMLQGLLDTDGYACVRENADGMASQAEYCSTSKALADTVVEIVRSLGGRARLRYKPETHSQAGPGLPAWIVAITLEEMCPFRLSRKADVWGPERKRKWRPRIADVIDDGEAPCVCIQVDSPDSLYVTRNYLLTHNSTSTIISLVSAFGPGYVICCGDRSGMGPAARRTKDFGFDIVRDENGMEAAIKEARRMVKEEGSKWVFIDDFSLYASFLEGELRDASARASGKGEPDGRRYWPEFRQRITNVVRRLFDIKAHVVAASHFIEASPEITDPKTGNTQRRKAGKGIMPMISGSAREEIPALFHDVLFMEKLDDGRRVFQVNPEGVWGPGSRSVDGSHTIDADFGVFWKMSRESGNGKGGKK